MSFQKEIEERLEVASKDVKLTSSAHDFMVASVDPKYSYNFSWLGRPIIQYPQDMVAMQELLWEVKPDLIIETGIAHGGSLIFYSSILELIATCTGQEGEILGIDVDIREHNRKAIEEHPMFKRISMLQGSSTDPEIVAQVIEKTKGKKRILVCLDSNHTHEHVLAELEAYAELTSVGSYCVVFDTLIEDMGEDAYFDRSWGVGNNPKTAVWKYLESHPEFEIDKSIDHKLLISVAPDGYLKRVK
ncbi:MAG: cephalosporin hydroxylase [Rhodobacterales bacterium]|jgi:cephalosporin hydroxylase|nr:cephalosporin hydroxylase [Rhodobacterales bacterium]